MRTVKELFAEVVSFLVLVSIIAGIFTIIGNPWEIGKSEKTPFLIRFLFWTGVSALLLFNANYLKELPKKLFGFLLILCWSVAAVCLLYLLILKAFPEEGGWVAFVVFLTMLGSLHRASDSFCGFVNKVARKFRKSSDRER